MGIGGGWGDDVEMWRRWSPILLAMMKKRCRCPTSTCWRHLRSGTVEWWIHQYGHWCRARFRRHRRQSNPDAASLSRRGSLAREPVESRHWWAHDATNDLGHRQFKSSYFSFAKLSDAKIDCDTPYHTRNSTLLLWQQPMMTRLKPLYRSGCPPDGIFNARSQKIGWDPTRSHRLSFGGTVWRWLVESRLSLHRRHLSISRAFSMLGQAMVLAAQQQADPHVQLIDHLTQRSLEITDDASEEGSEAWAMKEIKGKLMSVLEKQWLLNGASSSDDLLREQGGHYIRYRMTGEEENLESALVNPTTALSWNKAMYTSEVRFTDRVLKFHTRYWNSIAEEPLPGVDTSILYNMVTGDIGDASILPLPAVRWGFSHQILRVNVQTANSTVLHAQLYNTSTEEQSGTVYLQRLDEGARQYTLQYESFEHTKTSKAMRSLTLPAQTCTMRLESNIFTVCLCPVGKRSFQRQWTHHRCVWKSGWIVWRSWHSWYWSLCFEIHFVPKQIQTGSIPSKQHHRAITFYAWAQRVCWRGPRFCRAGCRCGFGQRLAPLASADRGQFSALDQQWELSTGVLAFSISNGINGDGVNIPMWSQLAGSGNGPFYSNTLGIPVDNLSASFWQWRALWSTYRIPTKWTTAAPQQLWTAVGVGFCENHHIPIVSDRVSFARISCPGYYWIIPWSTGIRVINVANQNTNDQNQDWIA